jgi:cytochrome b
MTQEVPEAPARVRVWDLPVRIVHWLMVVAVVTSWWTAETGRMDWHQRSGYMLLGLVIFRLYWGFFGSSTARFSQFVRGPRSILSYVRGRWVATPGHNPLGALSVVALLVLLLAQVVLGLFAVDVDGIESGPLSMYVSFEAGRAAAGWHEDLFDVLTWLIFLHLAAVLYAEFIKKQKLVPAMFHGKGRKLEDHPPTEAVPARRFLIGVILAVTLTWMVTRAFQFF